MTHLVGGHAGQGGLHLVGDELHGHPQLPLLQALAHADDGIEPGLQGGVDLLVDRDVGLVVVLAALGVADDDVLHAGLLEHLCGDLAGVGAVGLVVAVLRADGDAAVLEQADGRGDVHKGHAEHHLAPLGPADEGLDLLGKGPGLGDGLVHLPVSGNNGFSVTAVHSEQSFRLLNLIVEKLRIPICTPGFVNCHPGQFREITNYPLSIVNSQLLI